VFDSIHSLADVRERSWYAWRGWWRKQHLEEPEAEPDPRTAWDAAWQQGGADALLRSSQAAELTRRLEELTTLYRELESGSPYWHTEDRR
jgi:hypothetical protein